MATTAFLIFVMVYAPVMCLISVVAGAYLMYCRERQINPLRGGLADFWPFPRREEIEEGEIPPMKKREEESKGFYS